MTHVSDMLENPTPVLRTPAREDGAAIWDLIRSCKPLDENSMYCNLLQCDHFRDTCVLAEVGGKIGGWVSAYVLPSEPETLFVWQVAVAPHARGCGLGSLMLNTLLNRDVCSDVTRLQTTITADNKASWSLFRRFAKKRNAEVSVQPYFREDLHFQDRHKTENLMTIDLQQQMVKRAA